MKEKKKSTRLFITDITREGRGVSKTESELPPGLRRFFLCLKNNIGKLLSLNIMMVLGNFPFLFIIIALAGYTQKNYMLPLSDFYQNLLGHFFATGNNLGPLEMSQIAMEGMMHNTLAPTALTYVFYALGALFLFTFGLVNCGSAYVLRNMVSGEPVFVWADFWYAIKRNWKQALPFGIADGLICGIFCLNISSMVGGVTNFFQSFMFWSNIAILIVFFFMRYYIYLQMVTFDLKMFKIIKNSLIFSLLGFKRNFVAFLGIIILVFLELLFLIGAGGLLLPFAVALPLILMLSVCSLMKIFASYFKVKELMIDPYYQEHPDEKPTSAAESEEIIMHDDVTERERLEEIRRRNGLPSAEK